MNDLFFAAGLVVCLSLSWLAAAAEPVPGRDYTCFQTGSSYRPEIDVGSDMAIVYGVGNDFAARAAKWREKGYAVSLMTGIAWGGYDSYYMANGTFKKDEVQTTKSGRLYMHGDNIGYNVPTDGYIEYIKKYIEPAVDAGAQGIYLEEPEYWADTGWSAAFKQEWRKFYGEDWQPPDSSVNAQYRASRLKYELYFKALKEVFAHAKKRAAAQGRKIECHVPTHSLINYAQWRIVSPESHLIDIPDLDGYIAQVWTGTARSANVYRGVEKERTFETAYLEYGQALGMVRPTGKKVWFLADPVEDNPNRSWNDYKRNYECTVIASLMWPEVHRYEVMPWPDRIFQGTYPAVDMDAKSGKREGIPAEYATEILVLLNALNEMDQPSGPVFPTPGPAPARPCVGNTGPLAAQGIGVIVSDTLMFQRAQPHPSEAHLGAVYGLALPLVKNGVPVEMVQLENSIYPKCLSPYKVLLLTYEGQKPLKPEYHQAIEQWVRNGGGLVYFGDGKDPYHHVRAWWNDEGKNNATPADDLLRRLGVNENAHAHPQTIGKGYVRVLDESPADLQRQPEGAKKVLDAVEEVLGKTGGKLETRNFLRVQRGPFLVAATLDESVAETPLTLTGHFIDLLNPSLPVISEKKLQPNECGLLYDLAWPAQSGIKAKVLAAGARVKREAFKNGNCFSCTFRGPKATRCNARILLPKRPVKVVRKSGPVFPTPGPASARPGVGNTGPLGVGNTGPLPEGAFEQTWDASSSTLLLSFDNIADNLPFDIEF